jgi:hypothetical protein
MMDENKFDFGKPQLATKEKFNVATPQLRPIEKI